MAPPAGKRRAGGSRAAPIGGTSSAGRYPTAGAPPLYDAGDSPTPAVAAPCVVIEAVLHASARPRPSCGVGRRRGRRTRFTWEITTHGGGGGGDGGGCDHHGGRRRNAQQ